MYTLLTSSLLSFLEVLGKVLEYSVSLIGRQNFEEYTLSDTDIRQAIIIFVILLLIIVIVTKRNITDPKKISWALSLCNSFIMMNLGFFYLAAKADIKGLFSYGYEHNNLQEVFHANPSNFTSLTCLWFSVANIFDLVYGFIYRKNIDPVSGVFHHAVFIWMSLACSTGNGALFNFRKPFASSFAICLIEEIPTFLLALGKLFPLFRTNNGFGLSFFIFRIVYHTYFMTYAFYLKADTPVLVLFIMVFLLHVTWFQAWLKMYGPFARSRSSSIRSQ
jgi:hypothetical protein